MKGNFSIYVVWQRANENLSARKPYLPTRDEKMLEGPNSSEVEGTKVFSFQGSFTLTASFNSRAGSHFLRLWLMNYQNPGSITQDIQARGKGFPFQFSSVFLSLTSSYVTQHCKFWYFLTLCCTIIEK